MGATVLLRRLLVLVAVVGAVPGRHRVPFEHFYDEDATISRVFGGGRSWPTTAFYNARGTLVFTHQGAYATEAKLAEDIGRYALDG